MHGHLYATPSRSWHKYVTYGVLVSWQAFSTLPTMPHPARHFFCSPCVDLANPLGLRREQVLTFFVVLVLTLQPQVLEGKITKTSGIIHHMTMIYRIVHTKQSGLKGGVRDVPQMRHKGVYNGRVAR